MWEGGGGQDGVELGGEWDNCNSIIKEYIFKKNLTIRLAEALTELHHSEILPPVQCCLLCSPSPPLPFPFQPKELPNKLLEG